MTEMIRWTPTLFECQGGDFSSTKRYIRKAASGGYALASGGTVTGEWVSDGGVNKAATHRFKMGSVDWFTTFLGFTPNAPTPIVETVEI